MERSEGVDYWIENVEPRLHYVEWGDREAPPLLLLHGLGSLARAWQYVAPAFAARYRVIALDWRGHGDSDWATAGCYDYGHYMADLRGTIETLSLRDVSIVAHSLGGIVALYLAGERPKGLKSVVAVDCRTGFSAEELAKMRQQSLRSHREYATADEVVARFGTSLAPTAATQEALRTLGHHAVRQQPSGGWTLKFDRATLAVSGLDPWDRLSLVRVPTLVLRGAEGLMVSRDEAKAMGRAIAGARTAEIAGAYHHPFLDQPEAFVREVEAFWEGV